MLFAERTKQTTLIYSSVSSVFDGMYGAADTFSVVSSTELLVVLFDDLRSYLFTLEYLTSFFVLIWNDVIDIEDSGHSIAPLEMHIYGVINFTYLLLFPFVSSMWNEGFQSMLPIFFCFYKDLFLFGI